MSAPVPPTTAYISTSQAAKLLDVDVATLRMWMERFAFPTTIRSRDSRRLVSMDDVLALRTALRREWSVPGAIGRARESVDDARAGTERRSPGAG